MKMFKVIFLKRFEPIFIEADRIDKTDLHTNFVILNKDGLVEKIQRVETNNILAIREVK